PYGPGYPPSPAAIRAGHRPAPGRALARRRAPRARRPRRRGSAGGLRLQRRAVRGDDGHAGGPARLRHRLCARRGRRGARRRRGDRAHRGVHRGRRDPAADPGRARRRAGPAPAQHERAQRLRGLRQRAAGGGAALPRSRGRRRPGDGRGAAAGAGRTAPGAGDHRGHRRGPRRRPGRAGRPPAAGARGRGPAQRARQADRRPACCRTQSRSGLSRGHQPRQLRDGDEGGKRGHLLHGRDLGAHRAGDLAGRARQPDPGRLRARRRPGGVRARTQAGVAVSKGPIRRYDGPAGGWDALKSVARQLVKEDVGVGGAKALLHANQPDGFDCPGCAWPDRDHTSTFEFCENGAKAVAAEATRHRAGPELFAQYSVAQLSEYSDHWLEQQGRLTTPMRYDAATDHYVPASWDEVFALVARHLNALPSPDDAIFYTSGRTSNEAAFLYQLFAREYGTNNFPDCSNMCHESSGTALNPQIGVGKGTVSLQDFEQADCILVFGQNPGTNHPRMLGELRDAAKRGCRIAAFNPLRERGLERFADPQDKLEMVRGGSTKIASDYFQLKIGGDLAAVKGIIKHVLERDAQALARGEASLLDRDFIAAHTTGFDAFADDVRAERWNTIVEESGLDEAQLRAAGDLYLQSRRVIACWGMGITQHRHSVATIHMIANLMLLRGNIGRPGAGLCPVRGHSNVQGDRTMMIWEQPPAAFLDRLQQVFGFEPPRAHGYDTIAAIEAMIDGRAKVFF